MSLASEQELTFKSRQWRASSAGKRLTPLPSGLDWFYFKVTSFFSRLWPRKHRLNSYVNGVMSMERKFGEMTEAELKLKIVELRESFILGREQKEEIIQAVAIVREVAWRTLKMKPYKIGRAHV